MSRTEHHIKKKQKKTKLTREEMVYQAGRDLAGDIGMSFSEALGYYHTVIYYNAVIYIYIYIYIHCTLQ